MFVLAVAMNCLSTAEQIYETCAPEVARLLPASTEPPNTRAAQASVAADRRFVATARIIVVPRELRPSLDRGFTGPVPPQVPPGGLPANNPGRGSVLG